MKERMRYYPPVRQGKIWPLLCVRLLLLPAVAAALAGTVLLWQPTAGGIVSGWFLFLPAIAIVWGLTGPCYESYPIEDYDLWRAVEGVNKLWAAASTVDRTPAAAAALTVVHRLAAADPTDAAGTREKITARRDALDEYLTARRGARALDYGTDDLDALAAETQALAGLIASAPKR